MYNIINYTIYVSYKLCTMYNANYALYDIHILHMTMKLTALRISLRCPRDVMPICIRSISVNFSNR